MQVRRSLLALALIALVAAACGRDVGEPRDDVDGGPRTVLPATPTALPDADFETYAALLADLRGTPLVVNVWASWCGPCRLEAPALAEAVTGYGDRVQFLGLDVLDARPDARAFIQEYGWPYPSLFDRTGAIRDRLGLFGQPATLFYDTDGTLVDRYVGSITAEQLTEQIDALVT
ncbi:MAG: TlpA family protein disulfide reductase [Actinomycetota bacterium]